ncbi:hypothetical protein NDN08_008062 [Rhodosorus marinus]|uniref:Septum formation protein Maf n=1 Tax=Rhodosorus marinus TaxID=101924 RepID=A0AAV8V0Y5_9RHOD|nr:hypothetical protein NDN08_008062 [Rhodosorus marinus]
MEGFKLILGSGSASRKEILGEMGLEFEVLKADIDERAIRHEDPATLVSILGNKKADAILERINSKGVPKYEGEVFLLTGDQVVEHNGKILEKPLDEKEARTFIEGYNRAPARTVGSIIITNVKTGERFESVDTAEIYFHEIPGEVIDKLIEEGEVFYCAGGLKVEDPLVSRYVDHIAGGMDSVMGLSKATVERLLKNAMESASGAKAV